LIKIILKHRLKCFVDVKQWSMLQEYKWMHKTMSKRKDYISICLVNESFIKVFTIGDVETIYTNSNNER
jgi:hypothetical protein